MTGVGMWVAKLAQTISAEITNKERVVLDHFGRKVGASRKENQPRKWRYHPEIVRSNGNFCLLLKLYSFACSCCSDQY